MKEIHSCEGKVKLSLIKVWGDDNSTDENEFFRFPYAIKISKEGLYYILDSGNNRIQVFDENGHFKKTIGKRGQGPSDLLRPMAFDLDGNGNIVVFEFGNSRIQKLDPNGNYIHSFKVPHSMSTYLFLCSGEKIAVAFYHEPIWSNSIITIFDSTGTIKRKIGKPFPKPKSSKEVMGTPYICIDNRDNFLIGSMEIPFYRKYSFNGEPLAIVTYETPFKSTSVKINESIMEPVIGKRIMRKVSVNITSDLQNRVYLVMAKREEKNSEKYFLVSSRNDPYNMKRVPKIESENTDRFKLLIFNPNGKAIASCQLNVFCNNLYVHGERLFIIDSYIGMKIYEYRLSFIKGR